MKKIEVENFVDGGRILVPRDNLVTRVGVHGVVLGKGRVLVLESVNQRRFDLPGGELEAQETLEACLVRETAEETGLLIRPGRLLSVAEKFVWFGPGYPPWHMVRVYYAATAAGGKILENGNGEDSFAARFVPFEEAVGRVCEGLGISEAIEAARR